MTTAPELELHKEQPTVTALVVASNLQVQSEEDAGWASDHLAKLRKTRKAIEAKYKGLCDPFKDGLAKLKAEFDRVINPLKDAERQVEAAILDYRQRAREEAAVAQEQLEVQFEGSGVSAPMVQQPAKGFETTDGSKVTARRVPTYDIVDESKIPLEMEIDGVLTRLWYVDTAAIQKVRVKYGEKPSPIPGVTFGYRETLGVR